MMSLREFDPVSQSMHSLPMSWPSHSSESEFSASDFSSDLVAPASFFDLHDASSASMEALEPVLDDHVFEGHSFENLSRHSSRRSSVGDDSSGSYPMVHSEPSSLLSKNSTIYDFNNSDLELSRFPSMESNFPFNMNDSVSSQQMFPLDLNRNQYSHSDNRLSLNQDQYLQMSVQKQQQMRYLQLMQQRKIQQQQMQEPSQNFTSASIQRSNTYHGSQQSSVFVQNYQPADPYSNQQHNRMSSPAISSSRSLSKSLPVTMCNNNNNVSQFSGQTNFTQQHSLMNNNGMNVRAQGQGFMVPHNHMSSGNIPLSILAQQQQHLHQSSNNFNSMSGNVHGFLQTNMQSRIYQVQFKCANRYFTLAMNAPQVVEVGDMVIVEADRGEDLGVVTDVMPMKVFIERRVHLKGSEDDDNIIGRILRVASPSERQLLAEKYRDEEGVLHLCRELAYSTYRLPLVIHDVDYQYDRHKLTVYYCSETRVDFREFVRDLFSAYKARIWMKKLNPAKLPNLEQWATIGLATGMTMNKHSSVNPSQMHAAPMMRNHAMNHANQFHPNTHHQFGNVRR